MYLFPQPSPARLVEGGLLYLGAAALSGKVAGELNSYKEALLAGHTVLESPRGCCQQ